MPVKADCSEIGSDFADWIYRYTVSICICRQLPWEGHCQLLQVCILLRLLSLKASRVYDGMEVSCPFVRVSMPPE